MEMFCEKHESRFSKPFYCYLSISLKGEIWVKIFEPVCPTKLQNRNRYYAKETVNYAANQRLETLPIFRNHKVEPRDNGAVFFLWQSDCADPL